MEKKKVFTEDEEITINLAQALLLNAVRQEVDGVPFVMQILRRLKRQYKQWLIVY